MSRPQGSGSAFGVKGLVSALEGLSGSGFSGFGAWGFVLTGVGFRV